MKEKGSRFPSSCWIKRLDCCWWFKLQVVLFASLAVSLYTISCPPQRIVNCSKASRAFSTAFLRSPQQNRQHRTSFAASPSEAFVQHGGALWDAWLQPAVGKRCTWKRSAVPAVRHRSWPTTFLDYSCKGGPMGASPSDTYEINFIHNDFVQFVKQHSRYKVIFTSIILSQQCCEVYFISYSIGPVMRLGPLNSTEITPSS